MPTQRDRSPALPLLRGRDAERAVVRNRMDVLAGGPGGVLAVEGAPGSGKSSLLAEAVQAGRELGLSVFTAAAQPGSLGLPMSVLIEALANASEPAVHLPALRQAAERTGSPFWLLQELHDGLERAARRAPVVIMLDDFQWADLATVDAVGRLAGRLSAGPVLWLVAVRSRAPGPVQAVLDQLGADTVRLAPLDADAVGEIARDVLGARPDQRLTRLLASTGGSPLLLLELLRGLLDEDGIDLQAGVATLRAPATPRRFRESVRRQLERLSDDARWTVETASVLRGPFTAGQLARMLDRSPAALLAPIREALDTELMVEVGDRFSFRHDLVRDAIETGLPAPLRRALRRQAIDAGLAEGGSPAEVAALVMETATYGDQRDIQLLGRAATEIGLTSPLVAAQLSRHALGLARPDDPSRCSLFADTVTHLAHSGQVAQAYQLFQESHALLAPEAQAGLCHLIATTALQYDTAAAARICRHGLELRDLSAATRARLLSCLSSALLIDGAAEESSTAADAAAVAAANCGDPIAAASALITSAVAAFQGCQWAAGLRTIDGAIRERNTAEFGTRTVVLASAWKALMLNATGQLDEAWRLAQEGSQLAREEGQLANARVWAMVRGRIHLHAGRLADARAEAETILALSGQPGDDGYLGDLATFILGSVALHQGDQTAVTAARAGAARMITGPSPSRHRLGLWLSALAGEACGEPPSDLSDQLDEFFAGCVSVVTFAGHADVASLVRLLLRAGHRKRAEAAVARLEQEAARHAADPAVTAALRHAQGVLDGQPDLLRQAAECYAGDQRVLVRARVAEDAGTGMIGSDRDQGLAFLDQALGLWTAAGADRDAARVRERLRASGVRRRPPNRARAGWAGLTDAELKVARLVAGGRTNRQVAEELFLSPHTVSSHLRSAFTKLGIRSRVDLARLLTATPALPTRQRADGR